MITAFPTGSSTLKHRLSASRIQPFHSLPQTVRPGTSVFHWWDPAHLLPAALSKCYTTLLPSPKGTSTPVPKPCRGLEDISPPWLPFLTSSQAYLPHSPAHFKRLSPRNPTPISSKTPISIKRSVHIFFCSPKEPWAYWFPDTWLEYWKNSHSFPSPCKQNVLPCPTGCGIGHITCFNSGMWEDTVQVGTLNLFVAWF